MKNNQHFSLIGRAKSRANFQLTIASFAFAFSAIILGIGVAMFDGNILSTDTAAYTAGVIFAVFEFGCCVAMLALWVSLYNSLKPIEIVRRLIAGSLAIFSLILAYIACVVIVDVLYLAELVKGLDAMGWEAINGLVVAFTSIGLIVSIIMCVMVHSAAKRIEYAKEQIKEAFVDRMSR